MIGETMPRLADQIAFYKQVLDAAGDKPVVFRTLDLGGDKVLPYARWEREENPALGWRAIRIALDRPALLRYQVRALLTASAGSTLRMLLPMVSDVDEFNRGARADRPRNRARAIAFASATPAGAGGRDARSACACLHAAADHALGRFRFHRFERSVPFVFAVDRTNPRVARRYDPLNPAALTLIRLIVQKRCRGRWRR